MITEETKYLTNLRVLATVLVISLHICAGYMLNYNTEKWQWESINALDSLTRSCIGLFLMITGALLIKSDLSLKTFLLKRFTRIIYPFVFWSIVYIFFTYYIDAKPLDVIMDQSIYFGAYYHFWYIYVLIGIYLLLPVLSVFLIQASKVHIKYFLIIWTIWLFTNMHIFRDILPDINLTYFSGYIGYVVLGYYFHHISKKAKPYKIIGAITIGYLATFIGTSIVSTQHDQLETTFYQYLDINVCLMAAGIFLFFKYYVTKINSLIILLGKYSYGIYFVHPLFIYVLNHFGITFTHVWLIDVLIKTILVTFASLVCIYTLNKLPKGKLYIG